MRLPHVRYICLAVPCGIAACVSVSPPSFPQMSTPRASRLAWNAIAYSQGSTPIEDRQPCSRSNSRQHVNSNYTVLTRTTAPASKYPRAKNPRWKLTNASASRTSQQYSVAVRTASTRAGTKAETGVYYSDGVVDGAGAWVGMSRREMVYSESNIRV